MRIVFLSSGIRFLTTDVLANTPFAEVKDYRTRRAELILRLQQLREVMGVRLELCEITREMLRLPADKIIPGVGMVRSGVVRIAELQQKGYSYLKVEQAASILTITQNPALWSGHDNLPRHTAPVNVWVWTVSCRWHHLKPGGTIRNILLFRFMSSGKM